MKLIMLLIGISIFLESFIITLPLTLLLILFSSVAIQKKEIIALAFFAGILLDIFSLRTLGLSSLFFISLVFLVNQYKGKFEIETVNFVVIVSLFGSFLYLITAGIKYPSIITFNCNFRNLIHHF